jgi:hypothetical protein
MDTTPIRRIKATRTQPTHMGMARARRMGERRMGKRRQR